MLPGEGRLIGFGVRVSFFKRIPSPVTIIPILFDVVVFSVTDNVLFSEPSVSSGSMTDVKFLSVSSVTVVSPLPSILSVKLLSVSATSSIDSPEPSLITLTCSGAGVTSGLFCNFTPLLSGKSRLLTGWSP